MVVAHRAAIFSAFVLSSHMLVLCGAPPATGSASKAWASEKEVLANLGSMKEEDSVEVLRHCVSRSWWAAVRELIALGHARGETGHGSAPVHSLHTEVTKLLKEVKRDADDFAAFAEQTYRGQTKGLDEVNCAVQWAQNSTAIFLGVKYATRWSAPGAIEVVDVKVNITQSSFELEGFGHHSSIRKRYVVRLPLYQDVVPEHASWSAASVGRLTATLQKAKVAAWPRLLMSKDKNAAKSQIGKWLDMEEKWEKELSEATTPKDPTKKKNEKKLKESSSQEKAKKHVNPLWKKLRRWLRQVNRFLEQRRLLVIGLLIGFSFAVCLFIVRLVLNSTQSEAANGSARHRAAEAAEARSAAHKDDGEEPDKIPEADKAWANSLSGCCGVDRKTDVQPVTCE